MGDVNTNDYLKDGLTSNHEVYLYYDESWILKEAEWEQKVSVVFLRGPLTLRIKEVKIVK